jgi:signal transduction histidine kinase
MAEFKREMKNYLINRPMQMRMSYYFVSMSLALVGAGVVFLNYNMALIRNQISTMQGMSYSVVMSIESRINSMLYFSIAFLIATILLNLLYGIFISHRIAGPMFAILKVIENLRNGNYEDQRRLRPNDELGPIMDALHDLAGELKRKSKP